MTHTAKVLDNGCCQTVLLPAEFRFDTKEVRVRRDPATGDVILSPRPANWDAFFQLVDEGGIPQDFLADRVDAPASPGTAAMKTTYDEE